MNPTATLDVTAPTKHFQCLQCERTCDVQPIPVAPGVISYPNVRCGYCPGNPLMVVTVRPADR